LKLDNSSKQQKFAKQSVKYAEHNAIQVAEVVPTLLRTVFANADKGSVRGNAYRGKVTGSLWAEFRGRRIWGGLNRARKVIELREGSRLGHPIASFDNDTPKRKVISTVKDLRVLA
jgi:hypothetical protein